MAWRAVGLKYFRLSELKAGDEEQGYARACEAPAHLEPTANNPPTPSRLAGQIDLVVLCVVAVESFLKRRNPREEGFTLIEMSIALVIIGLIVGGVLVGRDLIRAAEVRAQITQIEKYNHAVNTFKGKYGGLPGNLDLSDTEQFGFYTGNCNGLYCADSNTTNGQACGRSGTGILAVYNSTLDEFEGEVQLFWEDLSAANLIKETIPGAGAPLRGCGKLTTPDMTLSQSPVVSYIGNYLPAAAIGYTNFVYVYSQNDMNYYGIAEVTMTYPGYSYDMEGYPNLPVALAYAIDKKIDDGLPTLGNVQTNYTYNGAFRAAPNTASDTSSTCYNTAANTYSITINGGTGANCALSFMFQ